jgi:hypothetical protein
LVSLELSPDRRSFVDVGCLVLQVGDIGYLVDYNCSRMRKVWEGCLVLLSCFQDLSQKKKRKKEKQKRKEETKESHFVIEKKSSLDKTTDASSSCFVLGAISRFSGYWFIV